MHKIKQRLFQLLKPHAIMIGRMPVGSMHDGFDIRQLVDFAHGMILDVQFFLPFHRRFIYKAVLAFGAVRPVQELMQHDYGSVLIPKGRTATNSAPGGCFKISFPIFQIPSDVVELKVC